MAGTQRGSGWERSRGGRAAQAPREADTGGLEESLGWALDEEAGAAAICKGGTATSGRRQQRVSGGHVFCMDRCLEVTPTGLGQWPWCPMSTQVSLQEQEKATSRLPRVGCHPPPQHIRGPPPATELPERWAGHAGSLPSTNQAERPGHLTTSFSNKVFLLNILEQGEREGEMERPQRETQFHLSLSC